MHLILIIFVLFLDERKASPLLFAGEPPLTLEQKKHRQQKIQKMFQYHADYHCRIWIEKYPNLEVTIKSEGRDPYNVSQTFLLLQGEAPREIQDLVKRELLSLNPPAYLYEVIEGLEGFGCFDLRD